MRAPSARLLIELFQERSSRAVSIAALIAILSLLLLHFATGAPTHTYSGYTPIEWGGGCKETEREIHGAKGSYLIEGGKGASAPLSCTSSPFVLQNTTVEFDLAAENRVKSRNNVTVLLLRADSTDAQEVVSLQPFADPSRIPSSWGSYRLKVPDALRGMSVNLQVEVKGGRKSWVALRGRVTHFEERAYGEGLFPPAISALIQGGWGVQWGLVSLFVLSITALLLRQKRGTTLLSFLLLGAALHLRVGLSFFSDDYTIVPEALCSGLGAIFIPHNEHFLPLFKALYGAQVRVFGDWYLGYHLISLAIHLVNCALVYRLLLGVFGAGHRLPLLFVAALFAAHSLQSEGVQWSLLQAISLSGTTLLLGTLFGVAYLDSGARIWLLSAALCTAASPLFFANGFMTVPTLFGISLLRVYSVQWERGVVRRAAALLISCAVVSALLFFVQLLHLPTPTKPPSLPGILGYLVTGSQVGTVLRSLGVGVDFAPFPLLPGVNPLGVYIVLGVGVSALAGLWVWRRGEREWLSVFIVGEALLVGAFLLPAIARWELGAGQALSLRYQVFALIPFTLALAAVALSLKERGVLILVLLLAIHTNFSLRFSDLQHVGDVTQGWRAKVAAEPAHAPVLPSFEIPIFEADTINRVYALLEAKRSGDGDLLPTSSKRALCIPPVE